MGTTTSGRTSAALPAIPGSSILQPFSQQQLAQSAAASAILRGASGAPQGLRPGKRFTQLVQSQSFTPVNGTAYNIILQPNPVGLVTKYFVEVITTVTNPSGGSTLTRSGFGPFCQLSNVSYTDPAQNNRINTYGWHIASIAAMRRRRVPGAAFTTDSPSGFGSTVQPVACPATIAASASGTVRCIYEVPLSTGYNSTRGAVVAGTVFSNQQLQVTFNSNFASTGSDPFNTVFTGAGTGADAPTLACTINLYQQYWDQQSKSLYGAMQPDLSTIYEIKSSFFNSLVANVDNYFRYSPLREYWSTVTLYDNGGAQNAGTDINTWSLQAANQTTFWQRSPQMQSFVERNAFGDNPPAGTNFFDTRDEPIITAADGNTTLNVNPSSAESGAVMYVGWEDIGIASVLAAAPSLTGMGGSS